MCGYREFPSLSRKNFVEGSANASLRKITLPLGRHAHRTEGSGPLVHRHSRSISSCQNSDGPYGLARGWKKDAIGCFRNSQIYGIMNI